MLAIQQMSPGFEALFFGLALAVFVIGFAVHWLIQPRQLSWMMLFSGLAFVTVVWFYNAVARA